VKHCARRLEPDFIAYCPLFLERGWKLLKTKETSMQKRAKRPKDRQKSAKVKLKRRGVAEAVSMAEWWTELWLA
jgi:hypothetical protein